MSKMTKNYEFNTNGISYFPIFEVEIRGLYQKFGGLWNYSGYVLLNVATEKAVLLRVFSGDKTQFYNSAIWVPKCKLAVRRYVGRYAYQMQGDSKYTGKFEWATRSNTERARKMVYQIHQEAWQKYHDNSNSFALKLFNACGELLANPQAIIAY